MVQEAEALTEQAIQEVLRPETPGFTTRDDTPPSQTRDTNNQNDAAVNLNQRGSDIRLRNVPDIRQTSLHMHKKPGRGQE